MLEGSEDFFSGTDDIVTRKYIHSLVENASKLEDKSRVITYISTLENEALEAALPSLCLLTENITGLDKMILLDICHMVLIDPLSNRGSRKACISCLKLLTGIGNCYNDFYIFLESLEEPQFHLIRPILSRWELILDSVRNETLTWKLASVILIRSLNHTNGWVRIWGLEKAVEIESAVVATDFKFIFGIVFQHLNAVDSLWRLLERNKLARFMKSLKTLLSGIYNAQIEKYAFIKELTMALNNLSCPQTFYYIAQMLAETDFKPILKGDDFYLIRSVLSKAHYIGMLSLRISTEYLLLKFFSNIIEWNAETKLDFGIITSVLTQDSPKAFEEFSKILLNAWKSSDYDPNIAIKSVCPENISMLDDCYRLIWIDAMANQKVSHLTSLISLDVCERLATLPTTRIDSMVYLLTTMPEESKLDEGIISSINGYILMKLAISEAKCSDFIILRKVYIPFLKKYYNWSLSILTNAVDCFSGDSEKSITPEKTAMLIILFDELVDQIGSVNEENFLLIEKYVGSNFIAGLRLKKHASESTKEFSMISAWAHSASLKLFQRFFKFVKIAPKEIVEEAIEVLDSTASYEVKQCLLEIIASNIQYISDSDLLIKAVKCADLVVSEEKKSQNYFPAISMVFAIGINQQVMNDDDAKKVLLEICIKYIELASLSPTVALVLANALTTYKLPLTPDWAPIIVKLAMFGPVPRKDTKIINDSYSQIYNMDCDLSCFLPPSSQERLHEITQRVRMQALLVAIKCSKNNETFATTIYDTIVTEFNILDASSSRSFGLSLPHRQKTRASALLLFCAEYINDKETLMKIFNFGISGIADPCQQFSIKLLIEWTLSRMSLKHSNIEVELINVNKKIAKERIGSVSSWLNILVHIFRVKNNKEYFERFITLILPWTTAQNFGVRCTAIAAATILYRSLSEQEQKNWPTVKSIIDFDLEPAGNSKRIIDNLLEDFYFAYLNVEKHFDFHTALVDIPSKTGLPADDTISEYLILELNDSEVSSKNDDEALSKASSIVYNALSKNSSCAPDMEFEEAEEDSYHSSNAQPGSENALQRKIDTAGREKKSDCSMIVVASLIDKPTNLGGLCRTSEIFGVDSLVIADQLLMQDANFKALSMSSENWQKIEAKRPQDLLPYLQQLRSEGYTVIAAEQTVDSVPMHKFQFPKKCALLMGDERKGVPTNLLQCVDRTVEIDQLGQTRSLNVHVTAALFISKYVEQVLLQ